jgi:hypothetical protein
MHVAKIEVELDDKGELAGKLPAELEALFKRTETTSYGTGLTKGREAALAEAQKLADEKLAQERAKWEKDNPVARVKELEEENLKFRESEATLAKRYGDNARQREETHAKEMADRAEQVAKRDAQLTKALKATIRGAAMAAGARDESLAELENLLIARVTRDADLEPVVLGDDEKPITVQGKPISVETFVKQYIDRNQHHKKPQGGKGGGASGGASLHGGGQVPSEDAARARIEAGDKSPAAIDALFQATRKQKAS